MRPYEKDRISIPAVGSAIPDAINVLDEVGERTLSDEHNLLRTAQEWGRICEDEPHVRPYMDDVLRHDGTLYLDFVEALYRANLVDFSFFL